MHFANSHIFWLLLLVPLAFLLGYLKSRRQKQSLRTFADTEVLGQLLPDYPRLLKKYFWAPFWFAALCGCIIIAALRPQWGFTWKERRSQGLDIVFALDVSESMLATDISPNRLVRAKREILDMLGHLKGDRAALVLFSGTAFLEIPLTLDYSVFQLFLSNLSTDLIPIKGTNIEIAVSESLRAFSKETKSQATNPASSKNSRALILLTDGEDFQGNLKNIRKLAENSGVRIYILGIGTSHGAPIPTANGHKRDKDGQVIISKLQQSSLESLAKATGGIYVKSISSERDVVALYDLGIIKDLDKRDLHDGREKRWNEYFQIPLFVALLLLFFGPHGRLLWTLKRTGSRSDQSKTTKKVLGSISTHILVFVAVTASSDYAVAESVDSLAAKAKQNYTDGAFEKALAGFSKAEEIDEANFHLTMARGASYYRLNRFQKAKKAFLEAYAKSPENREKAEALYNAGNSFVQLGSIKNAIKAYKESLKLEPDDKETKDNLDYAKKLLKQKEKPKKKEKEKEKEKQSNKSAKPKEPKKDKSSSDAKKPSEDNSKEKKDSSKNTPQTKQKKEQKKNNSAAQNSEKEPKKKNASQEKDQKKKENRTGAKKGDKERKEPTPSTNKPSDRSEEASDNKGKGLSQKELDKKQGSTHDQRNAQFKAVEEKSMAKMKYRLRRGMEQLEERNMSPPDKDW